MSLLYLIPLGAAAYLLGKRLERKNAQLSISASGFPCIDDLDGPKPSSWLGGTLPDLIGTPNVGTKDQEYVEEYGTVFRAKGTFGRSNTIYLADPKAMNYVLNTRGYTFDKGSQTEFARIFIGSNLVTTEHEDHARQRKILLPGFSQSSIRELLPAFVDVTEKLTSKLMDLYEQKSTETCTVNIHNWFSRLTLDAVGQGVFDYDFGSLGDSPSEYLKAYTTLFNESQKKPGSEKSLSRALAMFDLGLCLPLWLLRPVAKLFMNVGIAKKFRSTALEIASEIIEKEKKAAGDSPEGKKLMSVMVRSNLSEDVKLRLEDHELVGQLIIITIAAHDTTSTTMSWLFYQLSRHSDYQDKMRAEIMRFRAEMSGDKDPTPSDYESLPFTTAAIKETLRLYPFAGHNLRWATKDEVIPLSKSVQLRDGRSSDHIAVKKGQSLILSFSAYNRLKELWGDDADEWNPERFLGERANALPKSSIGVYANLASFSSGVHSCIGWRFAVLQLHVVTLMMVEKFIFSPEPDGADIYAAPVTGLLPFVKGREKDGVQLPLSMTPV